MLTRSFILTSSFLCAFFPLTLPASAADGVAIRSGTLRAGPGQSYPAVAPVARGDDLQIYGCIAGYTWCDVMAEGERGWLRGSRIAFVRNGNNVAIADGYSDFGLPVEEFTLNDYWGDYYGDQSWFASPRWRRGRNALPHNWQQNRGNWVHPRGGQEQTRGPGANSPVSHAAPTVQNHPTPQTTRRMHGPQRTVPLPDTRTHTRSVSPGPVNPTRTFNQVHVAPQRPVPQFHATQPQQQHTNPVQSAPQQQRHSPPAHGAPPPILPDHK